MFLYEKTLDGSGKEESLFNLKNTMGLDWLRCEVKEKREKTKVY